MASKNAKENTPEMCREDLIQPGQAIVDWGNSPEAEDNRPLYVIDFLSQSTSSPLLWATPDGIIQFANNTAQVFIRPDSGTLHGTSVKDLFSGINWEEWIPEPNTGLLKKEFDATLEVKNWQPLPLMLDCLFTRAGWLIRIRQKEEPARPDEIVRVGVSELMAINTHASLWLNKAFKIVECNPMAAELSGYPRETLISLAFTDLFPEENTDSLNHDHLLLWEAKTKKLQASDGKTLQVQLISKNVPAGTILFFRNIAPELEVREKLRINEEKYRILVENQTDLVVEVDPENNFLYVSPSYCRYFGKTEEELIGKSSISLIHPDDRDATALAMQKLYKEPYRCYIEQRVETPTGMRWLAWSDNAITDQAGNVTAIIGVGRDITDKKQTETAIIDSERKFRNLHESLMDGYAKTTPDGFIIECNRVFAEMTGYSADELKGQSFLDITPEKWHDSETNIYVKQVLEQGFTDIYEKEYIHKSGRIIPVEIRVFLLRDQQGNPEAVWAIVRDITRRKQAEQDLALFKSIVEASSEAIAISETNGRMIYTNPAFVRLFGRSPEENQDLNFRDFYPEDSLQALEEHVVPQLMIGQAWEGVLDVIDASGRRFPLWEIADVVCDENRQPQYFFGIMHDVSLQNEIEQVKQKNIRLEAEEAERLRLSRELHDHIGHIMTAIKLRMEGLIMKNQQTQACGELMEILEMIQFAFKELRLVSSHLTVNHPDERSLKEIITTLLHNFNKLGKMELLQNLDYLPETFSHSIRNNIIRILEEALTNAIKHSGASRVVVNTYRKDDRFVLSVHDNGKGLPDKLMDNSSGLRFMRQRAGVAGGTLTIRTKRGEFCEIILDIPAALDNLEAMPPTGIQ